MKTEATGRIGTAVLVAVLTVAAGRPTLAQAPRPQVDDWVPSPHYTPRSSRAIRYVVIHTVQGSYRGALSWFQNRRSRVSAHFVVAGDGRLGQSVAENDIAWHAGNSTYNALSIGIEHEGFVSDPGSYTEAMLRKSAALTRYLCDVYGVPIDRGHIVGHVEIPGATHTDPGPHFPWDHYMRLVQEAGRDPDRERRQRADFLTRFSNVSRRSMTVAQNDDGHMDIFYVGQNQVILHQWQRGPNQHWGEIEPMPGNPRAQEIVAGRNADGRLEIFYLGLSGIVYHQWQTGANQHWGPVMPMDGSPRARSIALARNSDGRLELFYVTPAGAVQHQWQWAPSGALTSRGYWSYPVPMPGTHAVERVAVALNADGRLEAFYVSSNRAILHQWQLAPNQDWGKPRPMDGSPLADSIAAVANADGRLEVFYLLGGAIRHQWQLAPAGAPVNGRYWSDPQPIRYAPGAVRRMLPLANPDGRLEIFYLRADASVYHQWQDAPNADWGGVTPVRGAGHAAPIKDLIGSQNADGRLELFYLSGDRSVWHNWQEAVNADWAPAQKMPGDPRPLE
ncbi:MAG: N-acetylmuramoyl-L-alanine amidase [Planctomycetes bacterium]|nr:N-acetylmuramoyl-L-alanine amidase [Planctomycetota bacterium]